MARAAAKVEMKFAVRDPDDTVLYASATLVGEAVNKLLTTVATLVSTSFGTVSDDDMTCVSIHVKTVIELKEKEQTVASFCVNVMTL